MIGSWKGGIIITNTNGNITITVNIMTRIMQVQKLVEDGDWKELATIMAPRLEFGTAGIRGRMGPGFGRMNDLVIIQVGKIDNQIFGCFSRWAKDCLHIS